MENILCLIHTTSEGSLPKAAWEIISAASELAKAITGGKFAVGIVGQAAETAADTIASCGASRFLGVSGPDFVQPRYASDLAAIEALVKASQPTFILAPGTSRWARVLPAAALRIQGKIDTHVSGWNLENGMLKIQRWYYRQRMMGVLTRAQRPWILSIDSGVFKPWSGAAGKAVFEKIAVTLTDSQKRTQITGVQAPAASAQTIRPDAKLLFVAGAGWTKKQQDGQPHLKEAGELIMNFLAASQASLGSSKSLVDQSGEGEVLPFLSHLNQVGQTGSTPRHPKGLATCCHGEEPHVVGWRFINERRAVNLDAGCGWAQGKADVLYVADAFQVMTKVNALLNLEPALK